MRDTSAQDTVVDTATRTREIRRRNITWAALGLILIGAAVFVALQWSAAERSVPIERLRIAEVTRGAFIRDISVRGTVVAAVSPTMFSPADGTVTLLVNAGDEVTIDQILATMDSPELTSRLEQERATLQSLETNLSRQGIEKKKADLATQQTADLARVEVTAAERELRRAETSREHDVISVRDYEKARDDLEKAELEYKHAVQNALLNSESLAFELRMLGLERDRQQLLVTDLERRVAGLEVRSPVDGMVGTLAVEQKAAVSRNTPLMTVVDLSAFEVEIRVPETYADDLALGMAADVSFGARQFPAVISAISPEVQNNEVTGRVRFEGAAPDGLRQNQRVTARVLLESKPDAIKVQRGPFLDSGGSRVAYVVEDHIAVRRPIRVGSASIGEVEILEGLTDGERIVISNLSAFEGAETVLLTR